MGKDPSSVESVSGSVENILFHNEENGFTIMQVQPPGNQGDITVLGNLPSVVAGEQIRANGKWVDDKRFGKQFRADSITALPPDSLEGIERFLSSGFIDGIGKTYAKRIVKKFGDTTFDVIEHESQKLEWVSGIGKNRRKQIKDSWNRQKSVRDIMIFLHAHGLSTARALRIFKNYGTESVAVLRKNPYRLAHDLPGVGFHTADQIASKLGSESESPQRIEAGIGYVLEQAGIQGHCALPAEELLKQASEILQVGNEHILPVLEAMISAELLIRETIEEQQLLFSPVLDEAEKAIALRLKAISHEPPGYPEIDIPHAIEWFERKNNIQLGEEQALAVEGAIRNRCLLLTGGPGTGKTTILNAILKILEAKSIHPVLCAPTGRAAQRLSESTGEEARTLHRLLEFQPDLGFMRNARKPLEGDLFVVDEASMIDTELFSRFLAALPEKAHLVLVGDVDQLPSVGPGTVLRDLIESDTLPVVRLQSIYRQARDSRIVEAAHTINRGQLPQTEDGPGSDFFFIERDSPESIADTVIHLVSERIPHGFGLDAARDVQVLTPMNRNSLGTKALNERLQNALNPPAELKFEIDRFGNTFRVGDRVIQTRNNYDHDIFNGDVGHIREITPEPVTIEVVFEGGRVVRFEPGELDELQPAYAITIHKSQGSEFPAVVIPVSMQQYILLQRNLIYTGITRGRKVVVVVGERKAFEYAVRNSESSRRWTGLKRRLQSTTFPPDHEALTSSEDQS